MSDLHLHSLSDARHGSFAIPDDGPGVVGRALDCAVQIVEENLSREHASIERRDGQWSVTDLGSKHGTELNGVGLNARARVTLADGDRLLFGGVAEFRVRISSPAPTTHVNVDDGQDPLETLPVLTNVEIEAPRLLHAALELSRDLNRAENEAALYSTACQFLANSLGDVLRSASVLIAPIADKQEIVVLARNAPVDRAGRAAALSEDLPVSGRVVREAARNMDSVVCLHRTAALSRLDATVPESVETVAATLIEYAADGRPIILYALGETRISKRQQWVADFLGLVAELTRHHLLLLRRSRLCKFFSPSVVEMMMQRGALESVESEPQRVEATTMFFDLRGFSLAFDCGLDDLLAVHADLQEVMSIVTEEVFAADGAVLDYHGDGLQAAWGVPIAQADQADRAVSCAKSILERLGTTDLRVFETARDSGQPVCGIGIDRGQVLAGPVGSRGQFKYGILGSSVNRASRLESLTRPSALDAPILVTEAVYEGLRDRAARGRRVARVQAAGMRFVIDVYEVFPTSDDGDDAPSAAEIDRWHATLERLEKSRTEDDLDEVRKASDDLPEWDRRTRWLRKQVDRLAADPNRLQVWDGVIRFESK